MSPLRVKLAATSLLAVPIFVLSFFAVAEMAGGEPSGAQHLVQAAPLLVLLVTAWWFPRQTGFVLLGLSVVLFVGWLVLLGASLLTETFEDWDAPIPVKVLVWTVAPLLLFVPPAAAGWLLLRAGRARRAHSHPPT